MNSNKKIKIIISIKIPSIRSSFHAHDGKMSNVSIQNHFSMDKRVGRIAFVALQQSMRNALYFMCAPTDFVVFFEMTQSNHLYASL